MQTIHVEKRRKSFVKESKDSVIFVPSTPGEILRRRIQKVMADKKFNVKVVEKSERNVKWVL